MEAKKPFGIGMALEKQVCFPLINGQYRRQQEEAKRKTGARREEKAPPTVRTLCGAVGIDIVRHLDVDRQ